MCKLHSCGAVSAEKPCGKRPCCQIQLKLNAIVAESDRVVLTVSACQQGAVCPSCKCHSSSQQESDPALADCRMTAIPEVP